MKTITQINITPDELQQMLDSAVDKAIRNYLDNSCTSVPKQEQLLTQNEAWEFLRCSKSTLYKWKREGRIPFYRICGKVYFKKNEIEQLFPNNN